jgi:hypothetical protein
MRCLRALVQHVVVPIQELWTAASEPITTTTTTSDSSSGVVLAEATAVSGGDESAAASDVGPVGARPVPGAGSEPMPTVEDSETVPSLPPSPAKPNYFVPKPAMAAVKAPAPSTGRSAASVLAGVFMDVKEFREVAGKVGSPITVLLAAFERLVADGGVWRDQGVFRAGAAAAMREETQGAQVQEAQRVGVRSWVHSCSSLCVSVWGGDRCWGRVWGGGGGR